MANQFLMELTSLQIVIILITGASAIITAFTSNKVAVAGSEVILECRTNTSRNLLWRQRFLNATAKDDPVNIIFTGNRFSNEAAERYEIIRESYGQFDLKFNATLNHGNEYMCIEPGGDNFSSQLIVLASKPKCYVNGIPVTSNLAMVYEGEYVELKCNLTFAGRWRPSLKWTQQINFEHDRVAVENQYETEKRYNIGFTSSTLGFKATHNANSFMCTTRFLESNRPKTTTAENIPEYSHAWISPTFVLRSFYETNYWNQDNGHNNDKIEMKGWALMSMILCVLLFISISVTISVTLRFTICCKKHQAQDHEEISLPMQCPLNVESLITEAIAARSEGNPTSMPAYEEVNFEPCIGRAVERTVITAGNTLSDDKYSALVKSDVIPLKPHNYETVRLSKMGD